MLLKIKSFLKCFKFFRNLHQKWINRKPFNLYVKKVKGASNVVDLDSQILWKSSFTITGSRNTIRIRNSKIIECLNIQIIGNDNIVELNEGCEIKNTIIFIDGNESLCRVGKFTTIESSEMYITEEKTSISIGSDCMISNEVMFRTGDSHSILDLETNSLLNQASNIEVGDHVWIGHRVTLLKNSSVASDSIIGTCSVVNKKFSEKNIVIAGVPAKKVKSSIRWVRERVLHGN